VPALIAAAALVGRKVAIRPKQFDDWTNVPNLWGAVIGSPGVQKTPAAEEAQKPIKKLAAEAIEAHASAVREWNIGQQIVKARGKATQSALEKAARGTASNADLRQMIETGAGEEEEKPTTKRYIVNDATVEALGERLKENPRGLLLCRDELSGWLRSLDKQGHEQDRAFYLEAFNGKGSFTYDRIARGEVHIENVCLSLFGTIQPGPLIRYIRGAADGSSVERDGLISRFQLMVYPDTPTYRRVDRWPDKEARSGAAHIYRALDELTPEAAGARTDFDGDIPYLRFNAEAQRFFNEWFDGLENRLRAGVETPLLEEHLAKYRSLMPSLALLFHLIDGVSGTGADGVSLQATIMAAAWCDFLESHARRIYQMAFDGDIESAAVLGERLSQLNEGFTAYDVSRKQWTGLTTREDVERALAHLEDNGWIKAIEQQAGDTGGRPTVRYAIHPQILEKAGDK